VGNSNRGNPAIHTVGGILIGAIASLLAGAIPAATAADSPAKALQQSPPDYPDAARSHSIEGWVEVEYTIGVDGAPKDVSVVDADPPRVFESSAVKAVQTWRFAPATRGDVPIESHKRNKFMFKP
jgi:protein TonB